MGVARALLILVHPGSLCGSLGYNLGSKEARCIREQVASDLESWDGDILVLDGDLSDELEHFPRLHSSISFAVASAAVNGIGERIEADDPEHADIALNYLVDNGIQKDTPIFLTGAWFDPSGRSGCVNAAQEVLIGAGFSSVSVMDSAATLDFYGDDECC